MNVVLLVALALGTRSVASLGNVEEKRSFIGQPFVDPSCVGAAERHAVAREGEPIKVGDTLQATRDVSLDEAIIAEGSKVSVSGKRSSSAGIVLDVALADGHVVKGVPLVEIRKSFRRVSSG